MNLDDLPLVLKPAEAAEPLRISTWQVRQLIDRGDIRAVRLGRCIRIPRTEIERLLGGVAPTSATRATSNDPGQEVCDERSPVC